MRAIVIIFAAVLSFVLIFACNEDSIFDPFEGILETDGNANVLGGDTGDWCYNTEEPIIVERITSDITEFWLPCSTFGDSAQWVISVTSTYVDPIIVTVVSTDTAMVISPDSLSLTNYQTQQFVIWFYMQGDSIHEGNIYFHTSAPGNDSLLSVLFRAGFVEFYVNDSITENEALAQEFALFPAYPNPASDTTRIRFDMPRACQAKLRIYNSDEDLVATLANGNLEAGTYEYAWDVIDVEPGIYKAYLETCNFTCQGDIQVE